MSRGDECGLLVSWSAIRTDNNNCVPVIGRDLVDITLKGGKSEVVQEAHMLKQKLTERGRAVPQAAATIIIRETERQLWCRVLEGNYAQNARRRRAGMVQSLVLCVISKFHVSMKEKSDVTQQQAQPLSALRRKLDRLAVPRDKQL